MAGRNTFRGGPHPTAEGALVGPYRLPEADRRRLEARLGRTLAPAEIEQVEVLVAEARALRAWAREAPTSQDVLRTLAALAALEPAQAAEALEACDEVTRAEITRALYALMRVRDAQILAHPPGPMIPAAARLALERLRPAGPGGRPAKVYLAQTAQAARALWQSLGGGPKGATAWTVEVLSVVENYPMDRRRVQRFLHPKR